MTRAKRIGTSHYFFSLLFILNCKMILLKYHYVYMIYDDANLQEFMELDDSDKFYHYLKIILSINGIDLQVEGNMSQNDYISLIDSLEIPVDFKYKYILMYQNHQRYFQEVLDMIELVAEQLKKEVSNALFSLFVTTPPPQAMT